MKLTTRVVDAVAEPMIYVSTRTSMQPSQIGKAVGSAFQLLGAFMGEKGVTPLAPPLAIYHDLRGGEVTVDVGFPVKAEDAAKASGNVRAGTTPGGAAIKTTHHGPYENFRETYDLLAQSMQAHGYTAGDMSWEVYFGDPATTDPKDLVTEIYMKLADNQAARRA